jgi:hypothetical protein
MRTGPESCVLDCKDCTSKEVFEIERAGVFPLLCPRLRDTYLGASLVSLLNSLNDVGVPAAGSGAFA